MLVLLLFLTIIRYPMLYALIVFFCFYSLRKEFLKLFLHIIVIEKKWKVEVNYKSSTRVITTTVHIVPDDKQQLQGNPELSPKHWMDFSQDGKRETVREMKKSELLYNDEFKKFR